MSEETGVFVKYYNNTNFGDSISLFTATAVQCPVLDVSNAGWNTTDVSYQTVVNITCLDGYAMNYHQTTAIVECSAEGAWSPSDFSNCSSLYYWIIINALVTIISFFF